MNMIRTIMGGFKPKRKVCGKRVLLRRPIGASTVFIDLYESLGEGSRERLLKANALAGKDKTCQ